MIPWGGLLTKQVLVNHVSQCSVRNTGCVGLAVKCCAISVLLVIDATESE
jgi:hypothetical protein